MTERTPDFYPGKGYDAARDLRNEGQSRKMHALFHETGLSDRTKRLAYISELLGHEIASTKDLTVLQANTVIDTLASLASRGEKFAEAVS